MAEKGETTRYSQIIAPCKSEVVSGPMPEPGSGQARIEVKACGVCASELHPWMEEHARYPFYLGHEASGVVHAVGPDVSGFAVGDRVTGLFAPAYAQFVLAGQNSMLHIPDGIPFEAALGEPLACLVNAQRRTHVELADRVALIGAGFMGLGMLQLIALRGPAKVIVVDVRQEALEKAFHSLQLETFNSKLFWRRYDSSSTRGRGPHSHAGLCEKTAGPGGRPDQVRLGSPA